jgi:hypothetical protein
MFASVFFPVRSIRKDAAMLNTMMADEGTVITADLEWAQEPEDLLRLLKDFGFTDQDIAQGTQTHARTVRRWKMAVPGTAAAERLAELRNLVLLLRETEALTDRGIVFWLRHANRLLEDYQPLGVLGAGGFRSVRGAALCFCNPNLKFEDPIPASVLESLRRSNDARQQAPSRASTTARQGKLAAVAP